MIEPKVHRNVMKARLEGLLWRSYGCGNC